MSLTVPVCTACGAAVFPPRALCPRCGAREWRAEPVESGVIVGVTERDGTRIAAVRTPLGPVVVVRLLAHAHAGDGVALSMIRSVPTASPS